MSMIRLSRTTLFSFAAGLVALLMVGCSSDKPILIDQVRANPTPEMQTIARTRNQRLNEHAVVRNTNRRQILDDIDAILLLDRPVRLTPYVIPQ